MISIQIPDRSQSIKAAINKHLTKYKMQGTADEFLQQLLENATFLPIYGMTESQKLEHRAIFANIAIDNNRNIGQESILKPRTIVGMTVLGLLGFLALGFTVVGAIGGSVLGIVLGRYIGRKISKRVSAKGSTMTEWDIFVIRVKCLIKWVRISIKPQCRLSVAQATFNLNLRRFTVQRLLTEIKPLLHYKYFDSKYYKESQYLIQKLQTLLAEDECLMPLCVSYRLSKEYIQIIQKQIIYSKFSSEQIQIVLAETVSDVLRPFHSLYESAPITKKNQTIANLVHRINKLLIHPVVLRCLEVHQDQDMTVQHIKEFSANLCNKIKIDDLEKYLSNHFYKGATLGAAQQSLQKVNGSPLRRKSQGDIVSQLEVEEELRAQQPLILSKRIRARSFELNRAATQPLQLEEIQFNHPQQFQQQDQLDQNESLKSKSPTPSKKSRNSSVQIQQGKCLFSSELETKFKMLIDLIEEPVEDWEVVLKKENIIIYRTFKAGNPAVFVKGHADLPNVKKEILFKAIAEEEYRKKWDKVLANFHVVERESDLVDIIYYYVPSPFGVANREFCQKRITKFDFPQPGQICLIYFSVDNKHAPVVKGHVRAETLISGYVIENTSQGSRLYFVSNNDVKGNIPKSLVNYVASRAPVSWINSLRQGCLDHDKILVQLEKDRLKKVGKR